MRKLIAIVLALVIVLSLVAPALAATEPVAIDNTAEVLAQTQMTLFIFIGVVVVLAVGFVILIVAKKNALKDEH